MFFKADIDDAMQTWVRECSLPRRTSDVAAAVAAGLLNPRGVDEPGYVCTESGRAWLVANALDNGADADEAARCVDYIDGAY